MELISLGIAIVLFLVLFSWSASAWLSRLLHRLTDARRLRSLDDVPERILIVVLGCPPLARSGRVNTYFTGRIASAAAAYHHTKGRRILCSGFVENDGTDEANALARALETASVPRDAVALDRDSARTIDSINCLVAHHAEEPVLIVTQPFHMARALYLARSRGVEAWGLIASGPTPGRAMRIREALAQIRAVVDVWLAPKRRSQPPS